MIGSVIGNALTRADILGSLWAVVVFSALFVAPGHSVAWITNLLGFRQRSAVQQLTWSVALSFALTPILAVMLGKYFSATIGWWAVMVCVAISLGTNLWALRKDKHKRLRWSRVIGIAVAVSWTVFIVAALVDVAIPNHLLLSVTIYDHALRTAFVDAVMRTGVPPANPLYWPGHAAPMRYYYFWYVVTAAAARLAGVTARQAFIASVVWAGFGLASIVALFCRNFLDTDIPAETTPVRRWPRVALALGLLAVTGLDILPAIAKAIFGLTADADMEWWSGDQVTSWLDSVIWVPHHVAGLVCCLVGFLLVWMSKGRSIAQRVGCAVVAGLAFASAFGLSIWVPLGFAMVMLAWLVWVMLWEQESRPRIPVLLAAGLVAVVALLPFLRELRTESADTIVAISAGSAANTTHFLEFAIRRIIDPDALLAFGWFANIAQMHPVVAGSFARLILLLPGYFVELGFFGLVLVAVLAASRRVKLDESSRACLFFVGAALLICTFLRSSVISSNDFGWRSSLIAQFFLLLLAVRWFEGAFGESRRWVRIALAATLWIGVAGTVYQQAMLRLYLAVQERIHSPEVAGLSERAMAFRLAFDEADTLIPKSASVQFNISQPSDYFRYAQVLHARRQIATAFPECASSFGGSAALCAGISDSVARLYGAGAMTSVAARQECTKLGVQYLVATRWDPGWDDLHSWVWDLPVVVKSSKARVLDCQ